MILLLLSAAWLVGLVVAGAGYPQAALASLPLGAGAIAAFTGHGRSSAAVMVAACVALYAAGSLWFERSHDRELGTIAASSDGATVSLRGVVADEPEDRAASQRFVLKVSESGTNGNWRPAAGKVLVTTQPFPEYEYGDYLELKAVIETPPSFEGFDYREYLAGRGIAAIAAYPHVRRLGSDGGSPVRSAIISVRDGLGNALSLALPEPEGALARGMLLGQRASIPPDLNDDFNRAGISHLIAISGSNVSLVAALAVASLRWPLGRRRAIVAAMLGIVAFVLLVGGSAPVLRAGIMGIVMLGAVLAGRPGSALTAIAFAAAVLTVVDPLAGLDVAFQLSFTATLGLIILEPPITRALQPAFERALPASASLWLAESVSVTAAASIAVFPITAASFERVSLIAIPANMAAVPLFGLVIVTSALAALAGVISEAAGTFTGRLAELPLSALIEIARAAASIPGASLSVSGIGTPAAAAGYAAIGAGVFLTSRRRRTPDAAGERVHVPLLLAPTVLVTVAAAVAWLAILLPGGGDLRVTVLDIGQGDAILIETPAGQRILVDGGPGGPALLNALGGALPSGAHRFDLVVLTHPQEDHVAGLVAISQRFDVAAAAVSGSDSSIGSYQAWLAEIKSDRTPVRVVEAGEFADLGGGVRLEVLGPPHERLSGTEDDLNSNCVVLRLTYGAVSFLLACDLSREGEEALLSARGDVRATVLKVGHHGSDGSSSQDFIAAVHPSVAVISDGAGNTYGHPSPTTLLRLAGVPIYRTDRNGTIRFETDGKRLFVKPDHGSYQLVPVSAAR